MANKWTSDPQYSHGYLVPLISLAMLYVRREQLQGAKILPSLWGVPLIGAAVGLRLVAAYYYIEWFDWISLIPLVMGLFLLCGGFGVLRWAWPAAAFLIFMIPLPFTVEVALREPLRQIGTITSTYCMQTMGLPAYSEGMVVIVGDVRIGVEEACSGMRMLMVFFALTTAVAFFSDRPLWEKIVVVCSSIPIALICNIIRILATGLCYVYGYKELADKIFHDLSGWLMMPMALLLVQAEMWFLRRVIIVEEERPMGMGLAANDPLSVV